MKVTVILIVIGVLGSHQRIGTGTRRLGNRKTRRDYPNYNMVETGHNPEKSLGDLRRLAVTQPPVENHGWKSCQKSKMIIIR